MVITLAGTSFTRIHDSQAQHLLSKLRIHRRADTAESSVVVLDGLNLLDDHHPHQYVLTPFKKIRYHARRQPERANE